jgi:hypothetical protein
VVERLGTVAGELDPKPLASYTLAFSTASFEIELEGSRLVARPRPGLELEVDAGVETLSSELEPLLSSLSVEGGAAIGFAAKKTEVIVYDASGTRAVSRGFGTAPVDAVVVSVTSGTERRRLLLLRIDWATKDPVYRDILDFFTEAKGAANPRPALTRLWERLEAKCGSEDAVRHTFSITKTELRAIKGDQSRYAGDRHANYPPGTQPARIDEGARHTALVIGRKIIAAYEHSEFSANGLPV